MKLKLVAVSALALIVTLAVLSLSAGTVGAKPTYGSPCANCHTADSAVSISVDATGNDGASTTYSFSVSGPYSGAIGYGVFDAAGNKVAGSYASSGTFTVADGGSYTFYGVNKDSGSMKGFESIELNPTSTSTPTPISTATPTATPTGTTTPQPTATATPKPTSTPGIEDDDEDVHEDVDQDVEDVDEDDDIEDVEVKPSPTMTATVASLPKQQYVEKESMERQDEKHEKEVDGQEASQQRNGKGDQHSSQQRQGEEEDDHDDDRDDEGDD